MNTRRLTFITCVVATATSFFALGAIHTRRLDAAANISYDARLDALGDELQRALRESNAGHKVLQGPTDVATSSAGSATSTAGSASSATGSSGDAAAASRAQMIGEIKEQLRNEMGLLPLSLLRARRSSFVELHTYDRDGAENYGTAGYLGHGYFITVKHAVVALGDSQAPSGDRTIGALRVVYKGKEIPARLVDAGNARVEVDKGDWAIIRTRDLDLPPLHVDPAFPYEFAAPIFRLGNDYSKGIVVSTGYVGQKTDNGLVTCLTDGHPGVSGGGVLDQRGALVGIPIGRMQGDYRFSFILPVRPEMLRKVPLDAAADSRALTTTH